jgi:hypothetical protein
VNFASWGVVRECLADYLPARLPQLRLYVISGFPDGVRAGGVRAQINEPLNISKRFFSRELLPDLRL